MVNVLALPLRISEFDPRCRKISIWDFSSIVAHANVPKFHPRFTSWVVAVCDACNEIVHKGMTCMTPVIYDEFV